MKTVNPRWGRIQELFNQAADMPLAERAGFLDVECGSDVILRKELDELLAADAGPPSDMQGGLRASLLTQAVGLAIEKTSKDRRAEMIGTIVGAYRLTAVLGHGGAGTVYLGERADRQYSAQVAVKVVEKALVHDDIAKRFQSERQILANLNHPHIARLLDAGETRTGQPFLVMEYVHGEAIDTYCNSHSLSITQRLQLFLKVCAAVQYAHQNLIVHRDLKPGNILVSPDGTPKLLDFGIAKLLDTSAQAAAELALTRISDRVLTPEYASPEQILGQNVATTSDVYTLGIVLYELLIGTRPYQVNAVSQLELERSICIIDPPRPSLMVEKLLAGDSSAKPVNIKETAAVRGITPKRLRNLLIGDLDAIVMRTLRKESEQRYTSVEQLVDDIKRHLDGQPVQARHGNWLYYAKRFTRRHALGVGMSTAAVVGLIGFAVMMSVQAKRIAEQRDLARQESSRAESVSNFMLEVFTAADPFEAQGKEVTAKELLDKAGQRIADDLNQQPQVRARLLEAIGRSYQRQREPQYAVKYLDDSLALLRKYNPDNTESIVRTLDYLGITHRELAEYQTASDLLVEGQNLLLKNNLNQTPLFLQILTDLGRVEHSRTNLVTAKTYFEQALKLSKIIYGNAHPETAAVLVDLGKIFLWQGNLDKAEQIIRESLSIYRTTLTDKHPDRIIAEQTLGDILLRKGQLDEAAELIEHSLSVQKQLYGNSNISITATLETLGLIQLKQKRWDAAETTARLALSIVAEKQGNKSSNIALFQTSLADVLIRRKKYTEAERMLRAAINVFEQSGDNKNQYLASAEYLLAELLIETNRSKQAESLLRQNIERWQQANAGSWRVARSRNLLGAALLQLKQFKEGRELLLSSYEVLSAKDSGASADVVVTAKQRVNHAGL